MSSQRFLFPTRRGGPPNLAVAAAAATAALRSSFAAALASTLRTSFASTLGGRASFASALGASLAGTRAGGGVIRVVIVVGKSSANIRGLVINGGGQGTDDSEENKLEFHGVVLVGAWWCGVGWSGVLRS